MNFTQKNRAGHGRPDWRGGLAAFVLMAFVSLSMGQVSVETIGGGVRKECGPSYGFVAGDTWTQAQFNQPYATALDSQGNLWVADLGNSAVEDVTLAGNESSSVTFETEEGASNKHWAPGVIGMATDSSDNLYVLTTNDFYLFPNVIEAAPALQNYVYMIALSQFSPAAATAIAVGNDAAATIYISFANGTIVRIPQSPPISNVHSVPNSVVVNNYPFAPAGLSIRVDGRLAVSDTLNDGIYLVATNAGSTPQLLTGGRGPGFENGSPNFAMFNQPRGIAASGDGRMVVCDTGNNYVRVIDTLGNTTNLYGTPTNVWIQTSCMANPPLYAGWVDGTAGSTSGSATAREPVSVTISTNGMLFVTELYYNLIRSVSGSGLTPVSALNSSNSSTNFPIVTTLAQTSVTGTTAILNASVNPNGSPATAYFQWGTTTNVLNNSSSTNLAASVVVDAVSATISGLTPNTTIYYQAVANNAGGTATGVQRSFITAGGPSATTLAATNITETAATLTGAINPEGATTSYYFESGLTTSYTNFTATNTVLGSAGTNVAVTAMLANLTANSTNHFQLVAFNDSGTNFGGDISFATPAIPPVFGINPSYGYFPECQTITVTSSIPNVYYTEDGSTPTTNSAQVPMTTTNSAGNYVGSFQWCNAQVDLSGLQMITASGGVVTPQQLVTSPPTNQVGFVRGPTNGIGSTAFVPIVLDLKSNISVESMQFLVEVTPNSGAPAITSLSLLPITSNDFVQFIGPAPGNAPVTLSTVPESSGSALLVYTYGPGTGLNIENYGVVGLLQFQIPASATVGQTYNLSVLYPSGTAAGGQVGVEITNMASQVLTVADLPYLAGDSAPAYGYSSEEFGDGVLDNRDVNNAIYASLLVRVPPIQSDIYNAMCVLPQTPNLNGNGVVTYQDWNDILLRSVGLDPANWLRSWSPGGALLGSPVAWSPSGPPAITTDTSSSPPPPGLVWQCEASLTVSTVTNLAPGKTCSMPVYANVQPGDSLGGFQFRATVSPVGDAPAAGSVEFEPAENVPSPMPELYGTNVNDIPVVWELGAFETPLENRSYIGNISFQVPSSAQQGQSYSVHLTGVDGGPDGTTDYSMESFPGYAWVLSTALQPASVTSDEWKIYFFGSLTNSLAADDVDADGDGVPNWQEYLAGTDPTNPKSVFQFAGAGVSTNANGGVALSWLTAPGKTYILQSIPALGGKSWTSINTNTGDGYTYQFSPNNYNADAQFYRISLQP
jgi:hypothetical protein